MKYIVGTRGSKLALVQTQGVCEALRSAYPAHEFEIRVIKTRGDLIQDKPLDQIGGKGVFVKEIEEQILSGQVQLGVHSMKDMPAIPAPGLEFAEAWEREDPRDVLILREAASLEALPAGAVIGTGSRRRSLQLKKLRPDLETVDIRGNVDTRLQKMEERKLDGIVLAAAGLHRLGRRDLITQYLEPEQMIPAPAQGVLALELRQGDEALKAMLDGLKSGETALCAAAERCFLREMGADCHAPAGAFCRRLGDGSFELRAMFGRGDGPDFMTVRLMGTDPVNLGTEAAAAVRRQLAGRVLLVGAGPGDPGLITVKGLNALRQADCIVYDRLVSPELLGEAKPGCELLYVGKENHRHTMPQEEINALLADRAMRYGLVVRLKGGDPYVFGRGGEEALYLAERGIAFEVVPGVSSAVAGPAYAGIPITHRGIAGGFHVVTAHDRRDALAEIDFKAMAAGRDTCVFLMGLGKIREIAGRLTEAGMSPDTPAAVISSATTPRQKTCFARLSRLAEEAERAGLDSPALIVVGETVALSGRLNFFEQPVRNTVPVGSLEGKRYLIPRIGRETLGVTSLLREAGADAQEVTVGEIVFRRLGLTCKFLQEQDWLVFTSKNGVEAFWADLEQNGVEGLPADLRIAAVGRKTQESLRAHGLAADLVPKDACGEALAGSLREILTEGENVCFFGADRTDGRLREILSPHCHFEERTAYENRGVEFPAMPAETLAGYDGILFTCASSARRFLERVQGAPWKDAEGGPIFYSIGPKCTACLKKFGLKDVRQAAEASYEALAECVTGRAGRAKID